MKRGNPVGWVQPTFPLTPIVIPDLTCPVPRYGIGNPVFTPLSLRAKRGNLWVGYYSYFVFPCFLVNFLTHVIVISESSGV